MLRGAERARRSFSSPQPGACCSTMSIHVNAHVGISRYVIGCIDHCRPGYMFKYGLESGLESGPQNLSAQTMARRTQLPHDTPHSGSHRHHRQRQRHRSCPATLTQAAAIWRTARKATERTGASHEVDDEDSGSGIRNSLRRSRRWPPRRRWLWEDSYFRDGG